MSMSASFIARNPSHNERLCPMLGAAFDLRRVVALCSRRVTPVERQTDI